MALLLCEARRRQQPRAHLFTSDKRISATSFTLARLAASLQLIFLLLLFFSSTTVAVAAAASEGDVTDGSDVGHRAAASSSSLPHKTFMGMVQEKEAHTVKKAAAVKEGKDTDSARAPPPSAPSSEPDTALFLSDKDCLALVGPYSRTLGGLDQPPLHTASDSEQCPADALVRSVSQAVDLSCRLYYHPQKTSAKTQATGAATVTPSSHSGVASVIPLHTSWRGSTSKGSSSSSTSGGGIPHKEEGPSSAAAYVPFPKRYRGMDKQSYKAHGSSFSFSASSPASNQNGVGYFDVLMGLPETTVASPFRSHRHLYFHHVAYEEAVARRGTEEREANERIPAGGAAMSYDSSNAATTTLFTRLCDMARRVWGDMVLVWLQQAWRALSQYPFYQPQALQRLFAVRTVHVSFPVMERERRVRQAASPGKGTEEESTADVDDDDEDSDVFLSPASRAALLSEGSLSKLRIVSFPPVPRTFRAQLDATRDGHSDAPGEGEKTVERLVCDFKAILEAAEYIREVDRERTRQLAEAEERRRQRLGLGDEDDEDIDDEEGEEDDDDDDDDWADGIDDGKLALDDEDDEDVIRRRRRRRGRDAAKSAGDEEARELRRLMRRRTRRRAASGSQGRDARRRTGDALTNPSASFVSSLLSSLTGGAVGRQRTYDDSRSYPTRSRRKTRENNGSSHGGLLSYFPMAQWLIRHLVSPVLGGSASRSRGASSPPSLLARLPIVSQILSVTSESRRGVGVYVSPPPASYALAKHYVDQVTEELGPYQAAAFSFTSDYVRYIIGQRTIYTSQRLVHLMEERAEEEEEKERGKNSRESSRRRAASREGASRDATHGSARFVRMRERELFVWRASLPATETMCLGFLALPPLAASAHEVPSAWGKKGDETTYALPLHLHTDMQWDWLWLKMFVTLLLFHVYIRRYCEDSRVFTFLFASLCGLFVLFFIFVFYVLKEIQRMSVGKMGLYVLLFFGGMTAFLEGVVSVTTLLWQQCLDALDATEGGIGFLSLFSSPDSVARHYGQPQQRARSASTLRNEKGLRMREDDTTADEDDLLGLYESQKNALLLIGVVALVILAMGTLSSLMVRCFVPERYLRSGTKWSTRAFLCLAWAFVFAANREATVTALVAYGVLLRPRVLLRLLAWGLRGCRRDNGAFVGHGRRGRDDVRQPQAAWPAPAKGPFFGRSFGEAAYEPTDAIPDAWRAYQPQTRPLACEGAAFFSVPSHGEARDGAGEEDEMPGGQGPRRSAGHSKPMTHAQKMRKYEADGAEHTRRALEELAKKIRASPAQYADRLRDPNSVHRWAGVADDDDDDDDFDDDDMGDDERE